MDNLDYSSVGIPTTKSLILNINPWRMNMGNKLVKFRHPLPEDGDNSMIYEIVEDNGDRCMIRPLGTGLPYPPIITVLTKDLVEVKES
jgi:hypothetical protein